MYMFREVHCMDVPTVCCQLMIEYYQGVARGNTARLFHLSQQKYVPSHHASFQSLNHCIIFVLF